MTAVSNHDSNSCSSARAEPFKPPERLYQPSPARANEVRWLLRPPRTLRASSIVEIPYLARLQLKAIPPAVFDPAKPSQALAPHPLQINYHHAPGDVPHMSCLLQRRQRHSSTLKGYLGDCALLDFLEQERWVGLGTRSSMNRCVSGVRLQPKPSWCRVTGDQRRICLRGRAERGNTRRH
jgi:hypothetical protein